MKLRDEFQHLHSSLAAFREETRIELAEIKKDIAYHIRRTDILETRQQRIHGLMEFLAVTGRLLVIGAAIAGILRVVFWTH